MKIKLDENIPALTGLVGLEHLNIDTVWEEGLSGKTDGDVWEAAQSESRFFVTQDLDFSDIRNFVPGSHSGILLLRISNPSRARIEARLVEILGSGDLLEWPQCFVVVTDSKVRVRRPS